MLKYPDVGGCLPEIFPNEPHHFGTGHGCVRKAFLEISSRISFFKKRKRKKNILLGQMTRLQVQGIKDLFLIETFSRQKDKSSKKKLSAEQGLNGKEFEGLSCLM